MRMLAAEAWRTPWKILRSAVRTWAVWYVRTEKHQTLQDKMRVVHFKAQACEEKAAVEEKKAKDHREKRQQAFQRKGAVCAQKFAKKKIASVFW